MKHYTFDELVFSASVMFLTINVEYSDMLTQGINSATIKCY